MIASLASQARGDGALLSALLDAGADPDAEGAGGLTPAQCAPTPSLASATSSGDLFTSLTYTRDLLTRRCILERVCAASLLPLHHAIGDISPDLAPLSRAASSPRFAIAPPPRATWLIESSARCAGVHA